MENKGTKIINKVKEYFEKARALHPEITNEMLDSNGAIYYMNGNDGTDFDWEANARCCEFYIFYKNEYGFIKVLVNANETLTGYMYLDEGHGEAIHLDEERLDVGDAFYLASLMYKIADKKDIWDESIDRFDFDTELEAYDFDCF